MRFLAFCILLSTLPTSVALAQEGEGYPITLVVHGGAGTILRENMTPELEAAYRAALAEALRVGYAVLSEGGRSLDAVEATLRVLEDSPLFNAGRGAVFTNDGIVELDASIMDGATRGAGAVAGVRHVRHPITLARRVMEASSHVMLVGDGAEVFAREQGLEMVPNTYFHTERRRQQLEAAQQGGSATGALHAPAVPAGDAMETVHKFGTVGAVALDRQGNLAAGTSTGGMTNKRWGRVGDSPIIGAGTYADNATCAVSATGHGEYFIRGVVAHDIAALMAYGGRSLQEAADHVILEKLGAAGGTGGVIALDREGHVAMPFNTPGMYRGVVDASGTVRVYIYRDE
ncbi:beta-aspartyl-peptidase [Rhodothermaceae bacterium RA]|nr:beta-aspartyl-peptidase [Rhodothermaceae bacterium RA]